MKTKKNVNPVFDNFQYLSPKQVTFSCYLRMYRRKYNLGLKDMAKICTLHGQPQGIKFDYMEIWNYENYRTIPTPRKFNILIQTIGINASML